MGLTLNHFLVLGAVLFCIGLYGAIAKRNGVAVLMGIEIMLNAVNITMVAFSFFNKVPRYATLLTGQIFAIFIIMVAAAEDAMVSHGEHSAEAHSDIPVVEFHDDIGLGETHPEADSDHQFLKVRGPHGEEEILEDEENPTVPELNMGARVSGYVGIVIVGL